MPPPRQINVGPYSFPILPGYTNHAEGFNVGPSELETLDIARAERVRKKAFKVYEKLRRESGRRTLTEGQLKLLTEAAAEFDRTLRLERTPDPRGGVTKRPFKPFAQFPADAVLEAPESEFDVEVTRLAVLKIEAEENARGTKLAPDVRDDAIVALKTDPAIREAARQRVEAQMAALDNMVESLF